MILIIDSNSNLKLILKKEFDNFINLKSKQYKNDIIIIRR